MYFDIPRFQKVARICVTNRQNCILMMREDVEVGDATIINKGTKFDDFAVTPDNKHGCIVRIGNVMMIGLTECISCK
jgi:hypothetical protein